MWWYRLLQIKWDYENSCRVRIRSLAVFVYPTVYLETDPVIVLQYAVYSTSNGARNTFQIIS
jgi:hypothetical protein